MSPLAAGKTERAPPENANGRKHQGRGSLPWTTSTITRPRMSATSFHFVPKHASWLNMVEIGVLRSQCLDRRIAERERLEIEVAAWQRQRNAQGARITWMFTTDRAREKMGQAYPDPNPPLAQAA